MATHHPQIDESEFNDLQRCHWANVRAIMKSVDSLFALMEADGDPPKKEVLRIAQDLIRDMRIKWKDDDLPAHTA
ncbi:hypothetical protein [Allopusillimonas ginsengisoli]|uniref:hypothetical protein n=1 Tax=Allopusillimonas ginsengisoli TaxID=453575 RepID=UPI0010219ED2|nr:hypothetical protein [Allopusillimonas ginsengisoli]TEA79809.1 hypothetical protein ERE07_02385 [Allopusillimonas ginsengisoli]